MHEMNNALLPGLDVSASTAAAPALTGAEWRALAAIDSFLADVGYVPSTRDLAAALGCWPSHAGRMLDALAAKGRIRRTRGAARGFVVIG